MNDILEKIQALVASDDVRISEHSYDSMLDDGLYAREIVAGISAAILVEAYPDFGKGPAVLVMQHDNAGEPIHVVWGIPKGYDRPAVLVTVYHPDPGRWDESLTRRLPR